MEYDIKLTDEFVGEIDEIFYYISLELKELQIAKNFIEKVINNILLLSKQPKSFARLNKSHKVKRQYRKLIVDNYIILYTIDEKKQEVYIAHIYYGRSNYLTSKL